jgi:predicted Zn-dependent peptidase
LFPGHPLGRETAGSRSTVASLTAPDVRTFFARWYRPATMVVAVAGPAAHDEVVAQVERHFAGAGDGGDRPVRTAPDDAVRPLAVLRRSTEQAHVVVAFRGPDREDPDREALDVLNHTLGGGMSSRLFEEIRERRGLAYSVFSAPSTYSDAGTMSVYAGTSPHQVHAVLDVVDTELDRIATDGIGADELAIAVGYLTGSFVLGLEDTGARMSRIGGHVTARGFVRPVDEQIERYRAVTLDDVRRVAQRVLSGARTLTVVGPVTKKSLAARATS